MLFYRAALPLSSRTLTNQGPERRGIGATLDLAWDLLARFPRHELRRVRQQILRSRHRPAAETGDHLPPVGAGP